MINTKKIQNNSGFTLIEMLIAVLIFSLSLASFMAITSKSLKTARNAQDQVIADYLAVEGVEIVHNLRDEALLKKLNNTTWEFVFQGGEDLISDDEGCFDGTGYCNFYFQPSDAQPVLGACPLDGCNVFFQKNDYYYYQIHEDGNSSPAPNSIRTHYKRKIKIESIDDGQVIVHVIVTWPGGEVTYSENLYLYQ